MESCLKFLEDGGAPGFPPLVTGVRNFAARLDANNRLTLIRRGIIQDEMERRKKCSKSRTQEVSMLGRKKRKSSSNPSLPGQSISVNTCTATYIITLEEKTAAYCTGPLENSYGSSGTSDTSDNDQASRPKKSHPGGLSDPSAAPVLDELSRVLSEARSICRSDKPFEFPKALVDKLLDCLTNVQPFVRKTDPIVFWDLVVKIDHDLPRIKLIRSLNQLFESLKKVQAGPLVTLERRPGLTDDEREMAVRMHCILESHPYKLPKALNEFRPILRIHSPRSYQNHPLPEGDLLAFLSLYMAHRRWLDENLINIPKCEEAYRLAVHLEHQPYIDVFKQFMSYDMPNMEYIRPAHFRAYELEKKWKQRKVPKNSFRIITFTPDHLAKWKSKTETTPARETCSQKRGQDRKRQ